MTAYRSPNRILLAGVYPQEPHPVTHMIDESRHLHCLGVHGIYLENVNDSERHPEITEDIPNIKEAIKRLKNLGVGNRRLFYTGKGTSLGVNILPDYQGMEYKTAIDLAKELHLQFVCIDMIVGKHKIGETELKPINESIYNHVHESIKRTHPNIVIIGGFNPPYAELVNPDILQQIRYISAIDLRADCAMVKAQLGEKEIPVSRVEEFATVRRRIATPGTRKLIIASGVTVDNIEKYLTIPQVAGFIVGSGLRKDGEIDGHKVKHLLEVIAAADSGRL